MIYFKNVIFSDFYDVKFLILISNNAKRLVVMRFFYD